MDLREAMIIWLWRSDVPGGEDCLIVWPKRRVIERRYYAARPYRREIITASWDDTKALRNLIYLAGWPIDVVLAVKEHGFPELAEKMRKIIDC